MKSEFVGEEKSKRVGLTLDNEQNKRLLALAEFDKKKPATLASEIVKAYLDKRIDDIESILHAKAEYERNVDALRNKRKTVAPT